MVTTTPGDLAGGHQPMTLISPELFVGMIWLWFGLLCAARWWEQWTEAEGPEGDER